LSQTVLPQQKVQGLRIRGGDAYPPGNEGRLPGCNTARCRPAVDVVRLVAVLSGNESAVNRVKMAPALCDGAGGGNNGGGKVDLRHCAMEPLIVEPATRACRVCILSGTSLAESDQELAELEVRSRGRDGWAYARLEVGVVSRVRPDV